VNVFKDDAYLYNCHSMTVDSLTLHFHEHFYQSTEKCVDKVFLHLFYKTMT